MYPMRSEHDLKIRNPYIFHLCGALAKHYNIVNYGKPTPGGPINILSYISQARIFYLNWVENSSGAKGIAFIAIFYFLKMLGKKVVWTHHNVHPHNQSSFICNSIIKLLTNKSDRIIIHTTESYQYLNLRKNNPRVFYFFHPFFCENMIKSKAGTAFQYDLLIWGNVRKSKGVDKFLQYLVENKLVDAFKVKIIGKFESTQYFEEFRKRFNSEFIDIQNQFLDEEMFSILHQTSRFIFFPYTGTSVLNSGALIKSLAMNTPIIGPNVGAFKEMADKGYIFKYHSFSEVVSLMKSGDRTAPDTGTLSRFIMEHSWTNFGHALRKNLNF